MLKVQVARLLVKSDAALVVADSTNLQSAREQEMRKFVKETFIGNYSNIWVFLNKCDNPDSGQELVKTAMNRYQELGVGLAEDRIFPTNAKNALMVTMYRMLASGTPEQKASLDQLNS